MSTEPALKTSLVVGVLNASVAAAAILRSGGNVWTAVGAGAASLAVSLGGGAAIRNRVEPVDLAEDRRTQAVAYAEGAEYREPVDDPSVGE